MNIENAFLALRIQTFENKKSMNFRNKKSKSEFLSFLAGKFKYGKMLIFVPKIKSEFWSFLVGKFKYGKMRKM